MIPAGLTPEAIARLIAARPVGKARRIEPQPPQHRPVVPAAVLVPLVARSDGVTIMLTQRSAHLANHGGQISFPGGRIEAEDADPVAAALRETFEETGLHSRHISIIGTLEDYLTGTGFHVTPVVGLVTPPFVLKADPLEVAEIFEIPLAFVLNSANHHLQSRVVEGTKRPFFHLPYEHRNIWGATAGMLVELHDVLSAGCVSS